MIGLGLQVFLRLFSTSFQSSLIFSRLASFVIFDATFQIFKFLFFIRGNDIWFSSAAPTGQFLFWFPDVSDRHLTLSIGVFEGFFGMSFSLLDSCDGV